VGQRRGPFIHATAPIGQAKTGAFTGLSIIKAGAEVTEECHRKNPQQLHFFVNHGATEGTEDAQRNRPCAFLRALRGSVVSLDAI